MNASSALGLIAGLLLSITASATTSDTPPARYAAIDIYTQQRAIQGLVDDDDETIEQIISDSGRYAPPVLYLLSNILMERGQSREAMYWFYTGQLRATSDIEKVRHASAHDAVASLNEFYGPAIHAYAFENIAQLEQVIEEVVLNDVAIKRRYDPRWVALRGKATWLSVSLTVEPAEHWDDINSGFRLAYLAGFRKAIHQIKTEEARSLHKAGGQP